MLIVVPTVIGYKLAELLEAMVITVKVPVVMLHGWATEFTRQEVAPLKEASATRSFRVYSCRNEPATVWNRGVTVNWMLLVPVCMAVSLLGSPTESVRAEMKTEGTTETVAEVVPQMMGAAAVMWARVSMLTQMLKMGLLSIQAEKVTVMVVPVGTTEGKPATCTVFTLGSEQTSASELRVEVLRQTVPSSIRSTSLATCTTKEGSSWQGSTILRVMYCRVSIQNSMGGATNSPSAFHRDRVGVQLTVCRGMLSSLTYKGVIELQGRLYRDTAPADISRGLQMLETVSRNCRPTMNCSLKTTRMMLALTTEVDRIWGGSPVTAIEVTREETVNSKLLEMVKRKVDRAVGTATPMVTSSSRVDTVVPGELAIWLLMDTRVSRLLLRSQRKSCPMFQFSSSMTPVLLMAYISRLWERAPTAGRLSSSRICNEQSVFAARAPLNPTTMVRVEATFSFSWLMTVVLIVRGFGLLPLAVFRLWQEMALSDRESRRVQDLGVIVDVQKGSTTSRYDIAPSSLARLKPITKLPGEDSVFGEATMGAVGRRPVAVNSSRARKRRREGGRGFVLVFIFRAYNHLFLLVKEGVWIAKVFR